MDSDLTALRSDDAARVRDIRRRVHAAEAALRARHPWLAHQDAIGAGVLLLAWAGILACGLGYARGLLPAWFCIVAVAFCASLTHELEHDLIHWLYFRRRPWAHHAMLALVWLARPSTINPWLRRALHFNHHRHSGSAIDIEERAITNGERWGPLRLLMTADAGVCVLVRALHAPDLRRALRTVLRAAAAYFPLGWMHWLGWWTFLALALGDALGLAWPASVDAWRPALQLAVVVWIAPNVLRSFCLHFISSNMHYYGDIEDGNLMQQTQVFTSRWLWPLQAFCFNFGGTHAIHHFVVGQPFYLRQWIAPAALRALRENGVRFDDYRALRAANRWHGREQRA
jgi:hypothetical protein